MKSRQRRWLTVTLLLSAWLSGCLASRSSIEGVFDRPVEPNLNAPPVTVMFLFRHQTQMHGFDTIPKLQVSGVKDFDNLFRDALTEISNVSRYETFTEMPNDVNDPKRREAIATARASMDYVIEIDLLEESSFAQQCLSGTVSILSMTMIPMPYAWDYTIRARVVAGDGRRVASFQRKATLTNWVQTVLIFAYPFYPLEGKREEIYSDSLRDVFGQIEAEKVLK